MLAYTCMDVVVFAYTLVCWIGYDEDRYLFCWSIPCTVRRILEYYNHERHKKVGETREKQREERFDHFLNIR